MNNISTTLQYRCTPDSINNLKDNEIYVFGSKPNGHHKSGAAKTATEKYGAIEGVSEGLSGQSYAIPVHKHHTDIMAEAVYRFIDFAGKNPNLVFYVLPIGCLSAGMDISVVANMFKGALGMHNVLLPAKFYPIIFKGKKANEIILSYKQEPEGIEFVGHISQYFDCDGIFSYPYDGVTLKLPDLVSGQPLKSIGVMCFEQECGMERLPIGCRVLIIPEGVDIVRHRAFNYNSSVEIIILPKTIKEIQSFAFAHCDKLRCVLFGNTNIKIWTTAFDSCPSVKFFTTVDCVIPASMKINDRLVDIPYISKKEFIESYLLDFTYSSILASYLETDEVTCPMEKIEEEITRCGEYEQCLCQDLKRINEEIFSAGLNKKLYTKSSLSHLKFKQRCCTQQILDTESQILELHKILNNYIRLGG